MAETHVTDFGMAERRQPTDGVVVGLRHRRRPRGLRLLPGPHGAAGPWGRRTARRWPMQSRPPRAWACRSSACYDSVGARIQEGLDVTRAIGRIFYANSSPAGQCPRSAPSWVLASAWRRIAGAHRLHVHGARHQPDVHHRSGRHQGSDGRRGDHGGPRRRQGALRGLRLCGCGGRERRRVPGWHPTAPELPPLQLRGAAPDRRDRRRSGSSLRRSGECGAGRVAQVLQHAERHQTSGGQRRFLRDQISIRPQHGGRVWAPGRAERWVRGQPAELASRRDRRRRRRTRPPASYASAMRSTFRS